MSFAAPARRDDTKASAFQSAALTVSANIYYGDEDEEQSPVSTRFYLLPASAVEILKSRNFHPVDENDEPLDGESAYLEALARAVAGRDDESRIISTLIQEAIRSCQIAALETDRRGIGKTKTIRSGNYHLFGYARIDDEFFVWNLPVRAALGRNRIEIDQHNAEGVINVE